MLRYLLLFCLSFASVAAAGDPDSAPKPSFDCAAAHTATEQAICATPSLAALDAHLADLYATLRASLPSAAGDGLRRDQLDWLGEFAGDCEKPATGTIEASSE